MSTEDAGWPIGSLTGLAAVLMVCSAPCPAESQYALEAVTKPSGDVTLSFVLPGIVRDVLIKEGDKVKSGAALVNLDDAVEQAELEFLKAQADDEVQIEAAVARRDQKRVDLRKFEQAAKKGASTQLEVENARLEVLIANLSLKLATFQRNQEGRRHKQAKLRVERMRVNSPIAGRVKKLFVSQGESVDALEDVIHVVKLDPLWANVQVSLGLARTLKLGQAAEVTFPGGRVAKGKITFLDPVAYVNKLTVRVELPNPTERFAGEKVFVKFMSTAKRPTVMKNPRKTHAPKEAADNKAPAGGRGASEARNPSKNRERVNG